jgi:hypothetical protein
MDAMFAAADRKAERRRRREVDEAETGPDERQDDSPAPHLR